MQQKPKVLCVDNFYHDMDLREESETIQPLFCLSGTKHPIPRSSKMLIHRLKAGFYSLIDARS